MTSRHALRLIAPLRPFTTLGTRLARVEHRVTLALALRAHLDDLEVLALEKPALMQGILDATKLAARQCRNYGGQPGTSSPA